MTGRAAGALGWFVLLALVLLALVLLLGTWLLVVAAVVVLLLAGALRLSHRRRTAAAAPPPAEPLKAGPMSPWAAALIDQELARLRDANNRRGPGYEAFAALMRDAGAGDLEDRDVPE